MSNWLLAIGYRIERMLMRLFGLTHRGVQALAFTSADELVLLELRYLRGWHLPGGRCRRHEEPRVAIVRELREELGPVGFEKLSFLGEVSEVSHGVNCKIAVFLISGFDMNSAKVRGIEVQSVRAWANDKLPPNCGTALHRLKHFEQALPALWGHKN